MSKCLVTGGAGFIGSHLVEALLKEGHSVTVFDNFSTGILENLSTVQSSIQLIKGDILDRDLLRQACQNIDFVFHQAASASVTASLKDPFIAHDVNVTGTINVLEAARLANVSRLIFASSAAVYGSDPILPKSEEHSPKPINPYGLSKYVGELYCQQFSSLFDIQAICFRYFNVYGPRQNPNSQYSGVISNFINKVKAGERPIIYGDGLQTRDFINVQDIVQALLLGLKPSKSSFAIYNVATGQGKNLFDILNAIEQCLGREIPVEYRPERRKDIRHSIGDNQKIIQQLGFKPQKEFVQGLNELVNYYHRDDSNQAKSSKKLVSQ